MKKIIALLLALVMALAMMGCAATEEPAEDPAEEPAVEEETPAEEPAEESEVVVMSHADYMAAELDTQVVIETYVQDKQSWWEDKATVYTQDEDGAYFLYEMNCSAEDYEKLVPGTKIRVTGHKTEWAGEIEIMDGTFEIIEGNYIAEPVDATVWLGTDELIAHQNELVSFKGMTVEASIDADGNEAAFLYSWDGSGEDGSDLYFNASVNGQTYTFTVESYLRDNTTDVYAAVKALQVGDVIDMEGFLYWYEGVNPHITVVTAAE
ncbi:MAG: hypothetical protein IJD21_03885 [Oscillospiraceae bacterium]|nr:hypothetical protein [Oscillospiraceae bacterium]